MANIRKATIDDVDEISFVLMTSWKAECRGIVNDAYLDALKDDHWVGYLFAGINNNSIFTFVLEDEKRITGVAVLSKGEDECEAHLISFYLLPEKIGQGYGHMLYSYVEKDLINKVAITCKLDVLAGNSRAITFYEDHGFVNTFETLRATLGEEEYSCLIYEKKLVEDN